MTDFISCFCEKSCLCDQTVKVADSTSSSSEAQYSNGKTVACLYNTILSTQKQFLITISWCAKSSTCQGLSIDIDTIPSQNCHFNMNSWRFQNKKGNRSFRFCNSKMDMFWDLSSARYEDDGPEPIDHFYVVVVVDSQIGLLLGDMDHEAALKKFKSSAPIAHFSLVARKEYIFGKSHYFTKARFSEGGAKHDILIKCMGDNGGRKDPELSVCVDRRMVIHVKRLHWKFRGNQMILVDGSPLNMTWDVHDWLFSQTSRNAVFGFGSSGLVAYERIGLPLLIYACNSP